MVLSLDKLNRFATLLERDIIEAFDRELEIWSFRNGTDASKECQSTLV